MKRILNSISARFRPVQRSLALAFLLVAAILPPSRAAQTSTNQADVSNRWLFIVDTSHAQKKRAESVRGIAGSLLMGGVNGQMRAGDTVGVWTYNETLHAGDLPLQEWTPDTNKKITQHVYEFLENQTFENDGDLDKVMPELTRLAKNSDFLTVILISDGSHEIRGTPFDDQINANYKTWRKELTDDQKLIVTLLRATHGKITDFRVNMPPWPFDAPPLPAELLVERTPVAKPQKPAPAPVSLPPLIISGRKPEATPTVSQAGPATGAGNPQSANAISATPVNPPIEKSAPQKSGPGLGEITAQARTTAQPVKAPLATSPQAAVALPPETQSGHKILWLATASGLVMILFAWIVLRVCRSRSSSVRINLVGRSLDRDET